MTSGPFHNIELQQNVRIELNLNFPQKIKKWKNMIFQHFFLTLVPPKHVTSNSFGPGNRDQKFEILVRAEIPPYNNPLGLQQ